MQFTIPIKVVAGDNAREHWSKRHKRVKAVRTATAWGWLAIRATVPRPELPVTVRLTRVAPRPLDGHDNLRSSLKPAADEITDRLGLPNDRDPRITFEYAQQRGAPKYYAVIVVIETTNPKE